MSVSIEVSGKEAEAVTADPLMDRRTGGALPLNEVPKFVESETGVRPHRGTGWRWKLQDKLAWYRVGGRIMTTRNAVRAFLASSAVRSRTARQDVEAAGIAAAARLEGSGA